MPFNEITEPVPVVDDDGNPVNFGWARKPFFTYDPPMQITPNIRSGESDRYILITPESLVIFEIIDEGYLRIVGASIVSFKNKKRSSHTFKIPFSQVGFQLPKDVETGSIRVQTKKFMINCAAMEGGVRIVKADMPRFGRRGFLRGEVVLSPPPDAELLATNLTWRENKNAFRSAARLPWYVVEGVIQYGEQELLFQKGSAWGFFERSRGVRPASDTRFWAAGCGASKGRQIGINVGYDSSDSEPGTANAFFLDGKLHKLDQVTFHINPSSWLLPWRFTSNDNRLEMEFTPHQERTDSYRWFFQSLKRRQIFGSYSGKVVLDDGNLFEFKDIVGMAERRKTKN